MTNPIFDVRGVDYDHPGGVPALRGISFCVDEGECIAVLGANASGKSTLFHLLDGLRFPTSGVIHAFGIHLTEDTVETPPFSREFRRQVGFLFQNSDAQLFSATVEEELAFGPLQLNLRADEIDQRVEDILQLLDIAHLKSRPPHLLSGGEKKRVALGSLLTVGPRVLLLDEPSAGLDPRTQTWLVGFLDTLHHAGITLLLASHDLEFVRRTADRAIILSEEHRIVHDGPAAAALADTDLLASANLI